MRGSLSSRSPRYTGWRSLLSAVHSVKRTCATSSGLTQCAGSLVLTAIENGDSVISRGFSSFRDALSSALIEPGSRVTDVGERARYRRRRRTDTRRAAARQSTGASAAARSSRRSRTPVDCRILSLRHAGLRLARVVRRAGVLGDQPFPVPPPRRAPAAPPVAAHLLAEPDASRTRARRSGPRGGLAARSTAAREDRRLRRGGYRKRSGRPAAPARCARRRASSVRWMRPCSRWKPAGRPSSSERDDLAVEEQRGAQPGARPWSRARTIDGNWVVFSLPSRDQMRTSAAAGCRLHVDQRADPVVFGLVEQRLGCRAGASASVASIGRTEAADCAPAGRGGAGDAGIIVRIPRPPTRAPGVPFSSPVPSAQPRNGR